MNYCTKLWIKNQVKSEILKKRKRRNESYGVSLTVSIGFKPTPIIKLL